MEHKKEWFNDEAFWEQYAPVIFDDARWAEVSLVADGVTQLSGLDLYRPFPGVKGGPRVLDLCCGFGRVTTELARRGFAATGVDITESFLRTAREDSEYEHLDAEFIQADARDFTKPCFFDLAVNLYISFGYCEDPEDDLLIVRNVYESLKPDRAFILETLGKEIAVRDFTESEWFERAGYKVLTEYAPLDSWSMLRNRWILVKDGRETEKIFTQRLYAASELRELFLRAGFSAAEIYGGWDESPYDQKAEKLIIVGRK
jgi:SAM-dependent methyltransferase